MPSACSFGPFRVMLLLGGIAWPLVARAQPGVPASEALPVVIERAPLAIRPASTYDVPLKLRAAKEIGIVALTEGIVLPLRIKPGDKAAAAAELLRLDARVRQLELERAEAALRVASEEQQKGGASALMDVARKDFEIAQARLEQTIIRMPWDGVVYRVHVVEGQYVRPGDLLVTAADPTRVQVETPIDRNTAKPGAAVDIKVEDVTVQGKLTAILPLSERLDPLRGLFASIASGVVEIDNADGRFLPGQTVYSAMIPRQPVAEAPSVAVSNSPEGGRKVQVIRDGSVRDVAVELLGQAGQEYVWVSGRFAPGDELILRTSEPLPDGTQVAPQTTAIGAAPGGTPPRAPAAPQAGPAPRPSAF
jgi:membrane fusion protein (multidrug efflux system)